MSQRPLVHVEIPAADRHATAEFYKQMFDWNYEHIAEPVPYTMSGEGHVSLGYSEPRDDFQVGSPLLYVGSEDIEADLKHAEALGGRVVQPKMEIPGFGWFGIFTDPTGNPVGLFTSV